MAELLERGTGRVKVLLAAELERRRLILRIAFEIAERVGAMIRLEIRRALAPLSDLQTQNSTAYHSAPARSVVPRRQ